MESFSDEAELSQSERGEEGGDLEEELSPETSSKESSENPKRKRLYLLRANGRIDLYTMREDSGYYGGIARSNLVKLSLQSGQYIGSVGIDLAKAFQNYHLRLRDEIDVEEVITYSTIGVNNINDQIIAVVIGKQRMPFGQREVPQQPHLFWDNEIEYIRRLFRVIGGQIYLSNLPVLEGVIDDVEIAVFESSENDFDIRGGVGASIRLTKWIETNEYTYSLSASYARKENSHLRRSTPMRMGRHHIGTIPRLRGLNGDEERMSVGFKMESAYSDDFVLWGEALYFDNSPLFSLMGLDSNFGLSVGNVSKFKEDYYISSEFTTVNRFKKTYGLGLWRKLHQSSNIQGLFLGGEYRHEDYDNGKRDNVLSVTLRLRFLYSKVLGK